jgi:hypothetical protein
MPVHRRSSTTPTGLFAGISLEGTVLIERKDTNKEFYGSPVPARDILGGRVPPPEIASRLYEIIEAAEVSLSPSFVCWFGRRAMFPPFVLRRRFGLRLLHIASVLAFYGK